MKANRSVRRALHAERLEDRQLLTSIVVDGSDSDDILIIVATDANSGSYQLNDGPAVPFSGIESLAFNAGDGSDRLEINNPPEGFFAPVSGAAHSVGVNYSGGAGADHLVILGGAAQRIEHSADQRYEVSLDIDDTLAVVATDVETVDDSVTAGTRYLRGNWTEQNRFFATDGRYGISWSDELQTLFSEPTELLQLSGPGRITLDSMPTVGVDLSIESRIEGFLRVLSQAGPLTTGRLQLSADHISIQGRLDVAGDIDVGSTEVRITPTGSIIAPSEGKVTMQGGQITMEDGAIIDGGSGDVSLHGHVGIQVAHVITDGNVLLQFDGGLDDGGDSLPDIVAKSVTLDGFHGSIGPLDTVVESIRGHCDGGRFEITNEGDLTVTGVGGFSEIQITTVPAANWGSGPGSLTIARGLGAHYAPIPVKLSAAGLLKMEDGAAITTDDPTRTGPLGGSVTLEFGDGLVIDQGSRLRTGEVMMHSSGAPDTTQLVEIAGAIDAKTTRIVGAHANETIDLRANENTNTSFTLDGGGGSDTYQIAFDLLRDLVPNTITIWDSGAGGDFDRLVFDQGGAEATDTGWAIMIGDERAAFYIGIEEVVLPASAGDFDADGSIGAADIDLLFAAIAAGSQEWRFDLNQDRRIGPEDVTVLIREVLHTEFGDADLNRRVDMTDFAPLADNFGRANVGWADGDFDGDGVVQFSDFVILADNFGFEG